MVVSGDRLGRAGWTSLTGGRTTAKRIHDTAIKPTSSHPVQRLRRPSVAHVQQVIRPEPIHAQSAEQTVRPGRIERHRDAVGDANERRPLARVVARQHLGERIGRRVGERDLAVEQDVVAEPAVEIVRAKTANEKVFPSVAEQGLRAGTADEDVVARSALDPVNAAVECDQIVPGPGVDDTPAGANGNLVVPAPRIDLLPAISGGDGIRAAAGPDDVVTAAPGDRVLTAAGINDVGAGSNAGFVVAEHRVAGRSRIEYVVSGPAYHTYGDSEHGGVQPVVACLQVDVHQREARNWRLRPDDLPNNTKRTVKLHQDAAVYHWPEADAVVARAALYGQHPAGHVDELEARERHSRRGTLFNSVRHLVSERDRADEVGRERVCKRPVVVESESADGRRADQDGLRVTPVRVRVVREDAGTCDCRRRV